MASWMWNHRHCPSYAMHKVNKSRFIKQQAAKKNKSKLVWLQRFGVSKFNFDKVLVLAYVLQVVSQVALGANMTISEFSNFLSGRLEANNKMTLFATFQFKGILFQRDTSKLTFISKGNLWENDGNQVLWNFSFQKQFLQYAYLTVKYLILIAKHSPVMNSTQISKSHCILAKLKRKWQIITFSFKM